MGDPVPYLAYEILCETTILMLDEVWAGPARPAVPGLPDELGGSAAIAALSPPGQPLLNNPMASS